MKSQFLELAHRCETVREGNALTREQLLVILIEECGEVIQAATKCLRFGYARDHAGYGVNDQVLSAEIGDLLGIAQALPLDQRILAEHRQSKLARAEEAHAKYGVRT